MGNQTPLAINTIRTDYQSPTLTITWDAVNDASAYYLMVSLMPRYMQSADELQALFDGVISDNQYSLTIPTEGYINICLMALGLESIPQKNIQTGLLLIV